MSPDELGPVSPDDPTPTPSPRPAVLPEPPYWAVIFCSLRTPGDHGYEQTAELMLRRAANAPGFLGVDSVRDGTGLGVTVSYWRDEASIAAWRSDAEHAAARARGRGQWYADLAVHVAYVHRAYRMAPDGAESAAAEANR